MTAAVGEASPYIRAQANLCTLGLHEMALDFYGALAANLQDSLDGGMGGEWVYSPAERAFWTEMEARVSEPLSYGWSGGWDNILDCGASLCSPSLQCASR